MAGRNTYNYHESGGNWIRASGGTPPPPPPPPPPSGMHFGSSTVTGAPSSATEISTMDSKFGVTVPVIRNYWGGAVSLPIPDASRRFVGSFKAISSTANMTTWMAGMYRSFYIHEIDSKVHKGEATIAGWQADMATLKKIGDPGFGVCVTADCFVNSGKNPSDYLVPGITHWGIDFDGLSPHSGSTYHDYTKELNAVKKFVAANGLTWGVPEFSADRAPGDPTGVNRAAWINNWSSQFIAAGCEYITWWETTGQPLSVASTTAEINALNALMVAHP